MDPFSISVGVIGLVGFVGSTISVTRNYLSSIRNRGSSVATLLGELETLKTNLLGLNDFLRREDSEGLVFERTSALRSGIASCEVKLKSLRDKLTQVDETRRGRYIWPLNEKEYQKALEELRAFSQWIQFALSIDGLSLLSRTSDDVVQVLERQIESFKVLKALELKTLRLQEAVEDQSRLLRDDRKNKKRQGIFNWLSKLDYNQKHVTLRSSRVDGTGGWLLKRPEYIEWRDGIPSNILWCHGVQGSGKTVLTTMVLDELKQSVSEREAVAFHYFVYQEQDSQTPSSVLSSILRQMLAQMPDIPQCVMDAYGKFESSTSTISLRELEKMIIHITKDLQRTYIVIDALDECMDSANRKPLLLFLDQISKQNSAVRLFVTSRPYPLDIYNAFHAQRQIRIQAQESDLRRYLYQEIDLAGVQDVVDPIFASRIVDILVGKAEGMFLLPVLQIRTILAQPTAGDIEDALSSLSETLSGAFEETIDRIRRLPENQKLLGMNILMWICHAKREMNLPELREALSVRAGQTALNPMYCPSPRIMETCCQGLVAIDHQTMAIRLAHYSVQEYLVGCSDQLFPHAEANLASSSLTYLLFDTFKQGPLSDAVEIEARLKSHQFLSYASKYWGMHVQQSENFPAVQQLVGKFFSLRSAMACANQIMQYTRLYQKVYWEPNECCSTTALHVASHFGLEETLHGLLDEKDVFVDEPTKMGTTALIKAASRGHVSIVKDLLSRGADPYLENWFGNALQCAAEAGKSDVIEVLISHGMHPNDYKPNGLSPIHCTLHNDRAAAFEALIGHGADIHMDDGKEGGLSIFHEAILSDCVNIVHLILGRQWVDPNSTSEHGHTAVHYAIKTRNSAVLRKLIKSGADVNIQDRRGILPLDYARSDGDGEIISLLLTNGAKSSLKT